MTRFTIAIVGRPNVGKSTLFNRLAGKKLALVDDTPGVTRDRRAAPGQLGDLTFTLIDTAGLEEAAPRTLEARMRRQTEDAVKQADLVLFVIDARAGITPLDRHFADWLRGAGGKIVLVANKCEGRAGSETLGEAYALGLGDPVPLSAEHGEGLGDLYDAVVAALPEQTALEEPDEEPGISEDAEGAARPLQLAVVGRPNVGKSTLVNRLLGEERLLTGPEAGITRDAIAVEWQWRDRPVRLVDTAGMRRKANVSEKLEALSVADTLRAVRFAEVVVLVLDAEAILEKQDLAIARMVVEEGRALVIAVNKWDLVRDRGAALQRLKDRLETSLTQVRGLPVVTLSARDGQGVDRLMPAVFRAYEAWNRRVSTGALNRWLAVATEEHPPPLAHGRRLRLRYMTQIKARPPTFALFASQPSEVPESYVRYIVNGIRERFDLAGVPIRVVMRARKNPFVGDEE